ncbi:MAG: cell division protein ZapA [Burkholderiaceae bacterium]|nr:cell division protein ZapA [Burkholderiaceae bacterium]
MKQIEVQILQQSYLLTCPEGHEARLQESVERVDAAMTRIRDSGKVRGRERIAVLAALNLAFEITDRQASDAAAGAPADTLPSPPSPATEAPALSDHDSQRLHALVHRLDQALADGTAA